MYFSFWLFGIDPVFYVPLAQRAEQLGFDNVWLGDHLAVPAEFQSKYPFSEDGRPSFREGTPWHDVWVTAAFLAGQTTRLKFGSAVYLLPLRNPFVAAQAIATAQSFSDGRVILGLGTGWLREEFELGEQPFAARGARMDEMLDLLDKLWSGQPFEHHGKYYDVPAMRYPLVPRVRPPLVFGGQAPVALRRAALRGVGWHGAGIAFDELVGVKRVVDELRRTAGRDRDPFAYYVPLHPPVTADTLRRYEDAGFDHLLAPVWAGLSATKSLADRLGNLERFANTVVAAGYKLEQSGPGQL